MAQNQSRGPGDDFPASEFNLEDFEALDDLLMRVRRDGGVDRRVVRQVTSDCASLTSVLEQDLYSVSQVTRAIEVAREILRQFENRDNESFWVDGYLTCAHDLLGYLSERPRRMAEGRLISERAAIEATIRYLLERGEMFPRRLIVQELEASHIDVKSPVNESNLSHVVRQLEEKKILVRVPSEKLPEDADKRQAWYRPSKGVDSGSAGTAVRAE